MREQGVRAQLTGAQVQLTEAQVQLIEAQVQLTEAPALLQVEAQQQEEVHREEMM